MNFFQFLKSLDDLLYEVVSWLLFYPVTLWRSIRSPIATMAYAEDELDNAVDSRFEALVSPTVQLLLTVLVALRAICGDAGRRDLCFLGQRTKRHAAASRPARPYLHAG